MREATNTELLMLAGMALFAIWLMTWPGIAFKVGGAVVLYGIAAATGYAPDLAQGMDVGMAILVAVALLGVCSLDIWNHDRHHMTQGAGGCSIMVLLVIAAGLLLMWGQL